MNRSRIRRAALAALLCALIAPAAAQAHLLLDEADALAPEHRESLVARLEEFEARTGIRPGVALLPDAEAFTRSESWAAFERLREGGSPDPREALIVIHHRRVTALNLGGELRGKMHSGGLLEQLRHVESETTELAIHRGLATLLGKVAPGDPLSMELRTEGERREVERLRGIERAALRARVRTWGLAALALAIVVGLVARRRKGRKSA